MWKLVQFIQETGTAEIIVQSKFLIPPNCELNTPKNAQIDANSTPTRRCYFGTLDLEVGNVILSGK